MKRLFPILLLFCLSSLLWTGCAPQKSDQAAIDQLEKKIEENEDNELALDLVQKYQSYVATYAEDVELNGRYLYRAAALEYRMENFAAAIDLLRQALRNYYESSNSGNNAALLAKIYQENLRNSTVANTIYQAMQSTFPEAIGKDVVLPSNLATVSARLDTLRQNIFNEQTYGINFQVANDYITSVESYALVAPADSLSPALLFKAGEVARSIQTFSKAVELLRWLHERYPDSTKDAQAMFLIAFTLDDGLKQYDEAKLAYEKFIAKYPNDPFADDAQFSLNNLGKDINELIDEFAKPDQE